MFYKLKQNVTSFVIKRKHFKIFEFHEPQENEN